MGELLGTAAFVGQGLSEYSSAEWRRKLFLLISQHLMSESIPVVARVRLIPDQPVEGCELSPDVFLLNGMPSSSSRLEYHWYRSTEKMACSWCDKTPVTIQRLTDNAYYCSANCFFAAWPGHAAQHRTGLTNRGPPRGDGAAPIEGWSLMEGQPDQQPEQKWVEVCDTQNYTPSGDDVGHMLKLVRSMLTMHLSLAVRHLSRATRRKIETHYAHL